MAFGLWALHPCHFITLRLCNAFLPHLITEHPMWAVESSYPPGWGWGGTGHSTLLLLDPLHFLLIMTWPDLASPGPSRLIWD